MAVSRAYRASGPERLVVLDKCSTLETEYLKLSHLWNMAVRGEGMDRKTRVIVAVGTYNQMKEYYARIPGYRKVTENIEKMRLVIRDKD